MGHPTPYRYRHTGKTEIVGWQVIGMGNQAQFCSVVG